MSATTKLDIIAMKDTNLKALKKYLEYLEIELSKPLGPIVHKQTEYEYQRCAELCIMARQELTQLQS